MSLEAKLSAACTGRTKTQGGLNKAQLEVLLRQRKPHLFERNMTRQEILAHLCPAQMPSAQMPSAQIPPIKQLPPELMYHIFNMDTENLLALREVDPHFRVLVNTYVKNTFRTKFKQPVPSTLSFEEAVYLIQKDIIPRQAHYIIRGGSRHLSNNAIELLNRQFPDKIVSATETLTHDGYDEYGPESDIWDLIIIDLSDNTTHSYHREVWYTEAGEQDYQQE